MKKYLLIFGAAVLLLTACKPTEKNYKNAYDAAYGAAQRKAEKEAESLSGGKLESLDGPQLEVVGSDSIPMGRERVKPYETQLPADGNKVGIAIARYKVPTNARRHLEDVKAEYPEAFVASDGGENYYVMVKRVASVPEALEPIRLYRLAHPADAYLGLGTPTLYTLVW